MEMLATFDRLVLASAKYELIVGQDTECISRERVKKSFFYWLAATRNRKRAI